MDPQKFDVFFNKLAATIKLSDIYAKEANSKTNKKIIDLNKPLFDALDLFENQEELFISDKLSVKRTQLMNHPFKVLFYLLIIQIEYQLYKIQKENEPSKKEKLQILTFNELIKGFLDNKELMQKQVIYKSKKEFKEDLKAISSFRNIIMHSNRKMQLSLEYKTIIKRKQQLMKLINALNEIRKAIEAK